MYVYIIYILTELELSSTHAHKEANVQTTTAAIPANILATSLEGMPGRLSAAAPRHMLAHVIMLVVWARSTALLAAPTAGSCPTPCIPNCRAHPRQWIPPASWANASYAPALHTIHCGVYDPSGTIIINGTYFVFPDGAFSNTHYASEDLLRWSMRNTSWF